MTTQKKKKTRNRERTQLLNGCSRSSMSIYPSNWDSAGASIDVYWYIFYRFYDPECADEFPTGKPCKIRGMNEYKTLGERRAVTKGLIEQEKDMIDVRGYNPITARYMREKEQEIGPEIPRDTPLLDALHAALDKIKCDHEVKICIKSVLKYIFIGIRQLRYDKLKVSEVKTYHMVTILDQMAVVKKEKWTANNFNHYRSHLMMLFELLILRGSIDFDPVEKIPKEQHVPAKRQILTDAERLQVSNHLLSTNRPFWLLMNIFYMTGCRRTEILRFKGKDVNLNTQKVSTLRKKGKYFKMIEYTITDTALPYWKEALKGCSPEDHVFSKGLVPGTAEAVARDEVTRRWREEVKIPLGIKADWYALKHLQTTETSDELGSAMAAAFNNESVNMIQTKYDVGYDERMHKLKKGIKREFLPTKCQ